MKTALCVLLIAFAPGAAPAQPSQSNATGPTNTGEPAATTVAPGGQLTGAALVPASGAAARKPDRGTRMGAGSTTIGLYSDQLARTGDLLSTATAANPSGPGNIANPGVRGGTAPLPKSSSSVSQTNLGAENTGTVNPATRTDSDQNRAPISQPGAAAPGMRGTSTGGTGSGTGR
jgi:hypothetical protein